MVQWLTLPHAKETLGYPKSLKLRKSETLVESPKWHRHVIRVPEQLVKRKPVCDGPAKYAITCALIDVNGV